MIILDKKHFTCLVILDRTKCFYFDSFGVPIMNIDIKNFLQKKYKKVTYSEVCVQSFNSNKCGEFCISFLKMVKDRKTYISFLKQFCNIDLSFNDNLI